MSSGRRESVMLFCISPISKVYLEPIGHYEPDIIHVFVDARDAPLSELSRKIYVSSRSDITCTNIVEHEVDVSDYNEVLGCIIDIMNGLGREYGSDLDIFINISSGTPEFSAAAMFASMLTKTAVAFKVETDLGMTADEIGKIISSIDASARVSEPERVTGLRNDRPDQEMIVFLGIVDRLLRESRYPKYRRIIDGLKDAGEWSYDPDRKSGYGRTSLEEKEERYLKRHYIAIALENGWLEKPSDRTIRLTDSGRAYLSVYRPEASFRDILARRCNAERSANLPESALGKCFMSVPDLEEDVSESEPLSNTVVLVSKDRKYTFSISMNQL
jgi:hypothetical protein